jgi:A/G-specific adenine glycosylase
MSLARSTPTELQGSQPVSSRTVSRRSVETSQLPVTDARVAGNGGFRRKLLGWYDENRRDLPWRRTRDPYAIWVSEIMLQQTRVAAVLAHYRLFLERFPTVLVLAAASEDDVLAAWSGLGYYRRARMLQQCAREIVGQHGGRFPEGSSALQELSGIGRYTAAAVASIAFGETVAVVDGNVERVLRRITGRNLTVAQSWQRAQEMLSTSRPGDFNQAMMELGATICLPREPSCLICPVREWCATRGKGLQPKPVSRQQKRQIWCGLEQRKGQVRLVKRANKVSLMAGMWELPQRAEIPHSSAREACWRTFRHSITVTDYTVHVLRDWRVPTGVRGARGRWIAIEKISQIPITGLTRKILRASGVI